MSTVTGEYLEKFIKLNGAILINVSFADQVTNLVIRDTLVQRRKHTRDLLIGNMAITISIELQRKKASIYYKVAI